MQYWQRSPWTEWGHGLYLLISIALITSVVYFPLDPGSILADVHEILVPLGISVGLVLFTVWLRQGHFDSEEIEKITRYGWIGALVSASIGGWGAVLHLSHGLPFGSVDNEVLTVWSLGVGGGIVLGAHVVRQQRRFPLDRNPILEETPPFDRSRVLEETTWIDRPGPEPIQNAIVDVLAELQGVDPLEMDALYDREADSLEADTLYDHVNPDVFEELRAQEDSQWQVIFYVDDYEIRVSSQGTVSVYDTVPPN